MFDRFKLVANELRCKRDYSKGVFIIFITNPIFCIFLRCSIQHLLRQGREAVIVAHELDVVSSEISEEAPTQAGDMVRGMIYETVTVFSRNPGYTALRFFLLHC